MIKYDITIKSSIYLFDTPCFISVVGKRKKTVKVHEMRSRNRSFANGYLEDGGVIKMFCE